MSGLLNSLIILRLISSKASNRYSSSYLVRNISKLGFSRSYNIESILVLVLVSVLASISALKESKAFRGDVSRIVAVIVAEAVTRVVSIV